MFSENMHKDIKEGHKRTYRSTETATRTKNENRGCKNHVNDEANGQNDREEINNSNVYKMCIFRQFITSRMEQISFKYIKKYVSKCGLDTFLITK